MSDVEATDDATHAALVLLAEKWLRRQNCGVVFRDSFRAVTEHGEQPDAIGWRSDASILVECKASRADFLADARKPFRADPAKGVGDWRFFLCPRGLLGVGDLPPGWGLLHALGGRIVTAHGVPGVGGWYASQPFEGHKRSEMRMLYAALRRMVLRGHFDAIYEPLGGDPSGEMAAHTLGSL